MMEDSTDTPAVKPTLDVDVIEAYNLLAQGKRNWVCGEVPQAVNQFQEACRLLTKKFGDVADECGDAYLCYGKALLEYSRLEGGVFGSALEESSEDEKADDSSEENNAEDEKERTDGEKSTATTQENGATETMNKEEDGEDDSAVSEDLEEEEVEEGGGQNSGGEVVNSVAEVAILRETPEISDLEDKLSGVEGPKDSTADAKQSPEDAKKPVDEVSNLQLAWEVLELAKVIFLRHETKRDVKLKLAETYLQLGEVGLESELYDQAIADFQECLRLQTELLEREDRRLAETYYQLGLACCLCGRYDDALGYYGQAVESIQAKISQLRNVLEAGEEEGKGKDFCDFDDPVYKARKEIDQLLEILPDIQAKMEDVEDEKKNCASVKKLLEESKSFSSHLGGDLASTSLGQQSSGQSSFAAAAGQSSSFGTSQQSPPFGEKLANETPPPVSQLVPRRKRKPEENPNDSSESSKKLKNDDVKTELNGSTKDDDITTKGLGSVKDSAHELPSTEQDPTVVETFVNIDVSSG